MNRFKTYTSRLVEAAAQELSAPVGSRYYISEEILTETVLSDVNITEASMRDIAIKAAHHAHSSNMSEKDAHRHIEDEVYSKANSMIKKGYGGAGGLMVRMSADDHITNGIKRYEKLKKAASK